MKLPYISLILAIILISCNKNKPSNQIFCKKNDFILKDTTFYDSEILSSIYYDDKCEIKKLELFVLLDGRSGNLKSINDLNDVAIKIGFFPDSLISLIIPKKEAIIFKKDTNSILQVKHIFNPPFLDSINLIDIKTISLEKTNSKIQILKSDSYFYNESKYILEIENTHLDFAAFAKTNTQFKNISKSKSKIDSILVTLKSNKNIDDITKYNIIINDTLALNFTNSIHANFKKRKTKGESISMYNLSKKNSDFASFKLDLSKINLKKINSIKVNLD